MNQSGMSAPQSSGIVDALAAVAPNVIPTAGSPSACSAWTHASASCGSPGPSYRVSCGVHCDASPSSWA